MVDFATLDPAVGNALAAPAAGSPGVLVGILLIMGSWCTVLASGALAPVLPQIRDAFLGTPHLDLMVGFVATMPALAVALMSIPVGRIADRLGLAQVMLAGLLVYGVAGVLPFWMESLHLIIATRFIVGIGEAAVMVTSTALIGLLFQGAARARWLGAQVAVANFLGIGVLAGSGLLGLAGWHAPFLIYGFALVLLAGCLLWVPKPRARDVGLPPPPLDRPTAALCLLTVESCLLVFVASMALFAVIVQAGFLLEERGGINSAMIGAGMAIAATGIAFGAAASGLLARWPTTRKVRIALLMMGGGMALIAATSSFAATAALSAVSGFGCGFFIPAMLTRLLGNVPSEALGSVTGFWTASTFLGQFANPPLFIWLRAITGSQTAAIGVFGGLCLIVLVLLPLLMRSERSRPGDA